MRVMSSGFLVRLREIRRPDRLLMLDPEQRLARLGVVLELHLRNRLGHVEQHRPESRQATSGDPQQNLRPGIGREAHEKPVFLRLVLDFELVQSHGVDPV